MENLVSELRGFIELFESEFGAYLVSSKAVRMVGSDLATKYFKLKTGKKKFSDWDLKCKLKAGIEFQQVEKIYKYVYNHSSLEAVGDFTTDSKIFSQNGRNKNIASSIQLMGFIRNRTYAPFFDLEIQGVENRYIRKLFSEDANKAFLDWSLLTCWRKIKNKHFIGINGYAWINTIFVLPAYSKKDDKRALLASPENFFIKELTSAKYKNVVNFLKN